MLKILKRLKALDVFAIICILALIVVQVWLDLRIPDYMQQMTKIITTQTDIDMSTIWLKGGHMLLCAFGSLLGAVATSVITAKLASSFAKRLRSQMYQKIESFSLGDIKRFSVASLITRTTNDVDQVQRTAVMGVQMLFKAPLMAIWAIIKISNNAWQWSIATCIAVVVICCMLSVIIIFAIPRFKKIQKLTDNLNLVTKENLEGVRVIRAYNAEHYQEQKFEDVNNKQIHNNLIIDRVMAIMNPGMTLVSNGLQLAIYWIGAYLIIQSSNPGVVFADMVVYITYAMKIVSAFMMLIFTFMMLPRASVSAKRINEVLDTKLSLTDGGKTAKTTTINNITFNNVSFKYPDAKECVITDISFNANIGETIAIIGSTGSGKSTLVNLLPRFYDVTSGSITIDGTNIKDYTQKDLHNLIGYVPQTAVLFKGTIKDNIKFGEQGKKIKNHDIDKACAVAQADFVKEKGINAEVSQNATNLSGGQKQRLSIARAIAKQPKIYIFDDSFSALDYKTDKALRKDLKQYTKNAITFIVAQRIGTILDADKILVLEQGKLVGIGTHKELLKSCDVYREIAYSQLDKKELQDE